MLLLQLLLIWVFLPLKHILLYIKWVIKASILPTPLTIKKREPTRTYVYGSPLNLSSIHTGLLNHKCTISRHGPPNGYWYDTSTGIYYDIPEYQGSEYRRYIPPHHRKEPPSPHNGECRSWTISAVHSTHFTLDNNIPL